MEDWAERRRAELMAKAPVKRAKVEPYAAKVDLATAARAFAATDSKKAMVWLWLLHQARKTGNRTIAVPNGALAKYGVSRKLKCPALHQLEDAGLIAVEWRLRKTPMATLLV
jgi:hypothetical protein